MNIKASINRVLLKKIKPENQIGDILLPEGSQEKSAKAMIIHIGEGNEKYNFVENTNVFIPTWAGTLVYKDSQKNEYIVIKADEILAMEGSK